MGKLFPSFLEGVLETSWLIKAVEKEDHSLMGVYHFAFPAKADGQQATSGGIDAPIMIFLGSGVAKL